ncbi:MAG: AAA family ATPase [Actinomycetota bacterium]|nr:AAA family ATPase [Actinomycetota bacterium]
MRICFAGKGGTGKTTLVGALARVLASRSRRVLVCDFDVNPGVELSLGPLDGDGRLPIDAAANSDVAQYGFQLRPGLSPGEAVVLYAARGPDGIRLLSFGTIDTAHHDLAQTHMAVRQIAASFNEPEWDVIVDMEAGTKDIYDGTYVSFVDLAVLVTDGTPVAELTCRRLASIARAQGGPPVSMVANKVTPHNLPRAQALAEELDVNLVGTVPRNDAVRRADLHGLALVDYAPNAPAVSAVHTLANGLRLEAEGILR